MVGLSKRYRGMGHTALPLMAAMIAVGAAATGGSSAARADVVVSQPFPDTPTASGLFQNGSAQVGFTFSGTPTITDAPGDLGEPLQAGQFTVTLTDTVTNASTTIQAYCGDIFNFLNLPSTYHVTTYTGQNAGILKNLLTVGNGLVNGAKGQPNQGILSAALQLAIWEVMNETTGTLDVKTGTFQADQDVGGTDPGVADQANADILDASNGTWVAPDNFAVELLSDPEDANQGLVFTQDPPAVPEPATVALFGASLVGLGLLRRRRR